MTRGALCGALAVWVALAALAVVAPAALADDGGWTLSREEMLNKDKVIVYLDHYPTKAKYLGEEAVFALLQYIGVEEILTFGMDLWLLQRVKFNLQMRLLDLQLDRLLHTRALTPEGYAPPGPEREDGPRKAGAEKDGDGYVNTARVTAKGPLDTVVYDDDEAQVRTMHPAIRIDKGPDKQTVVAGKIARFEVTLTNTGDVLLHRVRVMDPQAPGCELSLDALAPGERYEYVCEAVAAGDFHNVATVTGYDPNGGAVVSSDEAFVDAINPSIKIEKTPDQQLIVAGKRVTYSVTVTNTGDVPLFHVAVSDPQAPDCERMIDHLGVLESVSYDCSAVVGKPEDARYSVRHQEVREGGDKPDKDAPGGRKLLLSETFATRLGCLLHQDNALYEAKDLGLFVSPCEQSSSGDWTYGVWKNN